MLALFAVQTNLGENSNVVVIDAANEQKIQDMFWDMHQIITDVETVEVEPEEFEEEPNRTPSPQYHYIPHISVKGQTVDEVADAHHFSADQKGILNQLLSAEMRPTLLALCSGSTLSGGAGTLHWPLPGIHNITCRFGEPDAIRGQPHRGVDIAAPEGTPVLAAHNGTVLISGWNDSYGNQVILDDGAGLSTRYAHMTATTVTAGEIVTARQIIGYVDNTSDSTGNHLHFEVMENGVRIDPMLNVAP